MSKEGGRFQIVFGEVYFFEAKMQPSQPKVTILLDTETGKSWGLATHDKQPHFTWVELTGGPQPEGDKSVLPVSG